MSHKFRLREAYKKGQYFEHSSDALESVHFCDVCNKKMTSEFFYTNGAHLNLKKGSFEEMFLIMLDLCDDCFQGLKKNIEDAQKEGKML